MREHFYPRPPRGGRPWRLLWHNLSMTISIHALREEGDLTPFMVQPHFAQFLSTPSARRATMYASSRFLVRLFLSTPSARRATGALTRPLDFLRNFYPRPPRGGRPHSTHTLVFVHKFLSTPSARRATPVQARRCPPKNQFLSTPSARRATSLPTAREQPYQFLSTPSARRATRHIETILNEPTYFYPRPPRGGRRRWAHNDLCLQRFLSTPSARRATRNRDRHNQKLENFYPRPPRGGRRRSNGRKIWAFYFYPRPPRGGRRGMPWK